MNDYYDSLKELCPHV